MIQNCPECKQVMIPGHRVKMHPPKTYSAAQEHEYLAALKEKGYVWDDKEKRWVRGSEELSALQ